MRGGGYIVVGDPGVVGERGRGLTVWEGVIHPSGDMEESNRRKIVVLWSCVTGKTSRLLREERGKRRDCRAVGDIAQHIGVKPVPSSPSGSSWTSPPPDSLRGDTPPAVEMSKEI